jgi:Zn-dependent membrane protease YugP
MFYYDLKLLLWTSPAILLGLWAQYKVKSAYASAQQVPAPLSGAAAAQHVLSSAGVEGVEIEMTPGHLSDHYDPRARVLRLSPEVYNSRTAAAVGIAAHEAGHALQHAFGYAPLVVRNLAVPVANFGGGISIFFLMLGVFMHLGALLWIGIALFSAVVVFQVVNLPVEFNASTRAKQQLVGLNILNEEQMPYVRKVLNAAAMTYVAGTLQSVLTLAYYLSIASGRDRDD